MEFGLSSESEVFSYLRRRVTNKEVTQAARSIDGFRTRPTSNIMAGRTPTLTAPERGDNTYQSVARNPVSDFQRRPVLAETIREQVEPVVDTPRTETAVSHKRRLTFFHRSKNNDRKQRFYRIRHLTKVQAGLYLMAIMLFLGGLGVSIDGWRANVAVHAQVSKLTAAAASIPQSDGGTGSVAPGASVPSATGSHTSSYSVASDQPKYLKIPAIKVDARVISVGIIKDGSLGTPPPNTNQVGWFENSSKPGNAGAMVMDGHVSGLNTVGVFYNLKKLNAGDAVQIERGDGQTINYQVVKVVTYDADKVDMDALVNPVDYSKPGLNMITCAGQYDSKSEEFNQRTVVFTEQI